MSYDIEERFNHFHLDRFCRINVFILIIVFIKLNTFLYSTYIRHTNVSPKLAEVKNDALIVIT